MNTFKSRYHGIDVASALYTSVHSSICHTCNHLPFTKITLENQDHLGNIELMRNYVPLEQAYHSPLDSQTRLLQIFRLAPKKETNTSYQNLYFVIT